MPSATDRAAAFAPYALAALRIIAGLLFMEHGTQKLFGFPGLPQSGELPGVFTLLWFGAVLEFVGGILIVVGLFTRPVAFVLAGEMAVAYWAFHAPSNFYPALNGGDAAILFCFVFLYLAARGAGPFSVDGTRAKTL
ncbi:DoxX family protein [Aureimonas sp. Leaf454]|uniref:DoxX family protein n=1 Tax=Aureimonas sp. Leaf454 TaxID=1736381 RepID=UPI0006F9F019|nr:DoxX family protein [Aureimonas sp. Leaf454]KQT45212.1 DoxX family protein [Aureimonas sp. Leaf454]